MKAAPGVHVARISGSSRCQDLWLQHQVLLETFRAPLLLIRVNDRFRPQGGAVWGALRVTVQAHALRD